ncbi:MAG: DUF4345 domain-containing protein [Gammaproteobacteria bacterium]|nr:DUF4345 domain-containing protein [Gammaproteobacteria bacterium]
MAPFKRLALFLKIIAPIFLLVSAAHLLLGPGADNLLGAKIPAPVLADPVLDSQNRFYGVVFGLYGALFYLCSTNLQKYASVFSLTLLFFFAGGLARLVSIFQVGMPSGLVIMLLLTELLLPVILHLWRRRVAGQA